MTPMHSPYWRSMLILGAVVLAGYGLWNLGWMAWEWRGGWSWFALSLGYVGWWGW